MLLRVALVAGVIALAATAWCGISMSAIAAQPERVTFPSADGKTTLVGYLFKPDPLPALRVPAVVMMHGRAGAYSSRAKGVYDAATLSLRHQAWGRLWAEAGYIAVLVDGFGPRGYAQGFPRFSYRDRPAEVDEVAIRPLDAYGALAYLRTRSDVQPDRIGLQGWSNGGSATLAVPPLIAVPPPLLLELPPPLDPQPAAARASAATAATPARRSLCLPSFITLLLGDGRHLRTGRQIAPSVMTGRLLVGAGSITNCYRYATKTRQRLQSQPEKSCLVASRTHGVHAAVHMHDFSGCGREPVR